MSKNLRRFIIVISVLSILFSVYAIIDGQKLFDVIGGIVVGFSLIAALFLEKKNNEEI